MIWVWVVGRCAVVAGETCVEPFAVTVSREQAWAAMDHFLLFQPHRVLDVH